MYERRLKVGAHSLRLKADKKGQKCEEHAKKIKCVLRVINRLLRHYLPERPKHGHKSFIYDDAYQHLSASLSVFLFFYRRQQGQTSSLLFSYPTAHCIENDETVTTLMLGHHLRYGAFAVFVWRMLQFVMYGDSSGFAFASFRKKQD